MSSNVGGKSSRSKLNWTVIDIVQLGPSSFGLSKTNSVREPARICGGEIQIFTVSLNGAKQ